MSSNYLSISLLGKNLKINLIYKNINSITVDKTSTEINIIFPKKYKKTDKNELINMSIKKLYFEIAEKELYDAFELARHILNFSPSDCIIREISNDYYKCLTNNILVVSPDIVKYNKNIIHTTIIQAFCKIKFKSKSKAYTQTLNKALDMYNNLYSNNFYVISA